MEMYAMGMAHVLFRIEEKQFVHALVDLLARPASTIAQEMQSRKGRKAAMDMAHAPSTMTRQYANVKQVSWVQDVLCSAPNTRGRPAEVRENVTRIRVWPSANVSKDSWG
jgi:hypothetical protein